MRNLVVSQALQNSAVEQQVEKIFFSHPSFRFIVEQTLAGKTSDIREYTIGVAVFDRSAAFDPRADAVVGAEAQWLRSKHSIHIELQKSVRVPAIRERAR